MIPRTEPLEDRLLLSFVVTNLADSGTGSLRYELGLATGASQPVNISFAPGLAGTINLTSPLDVDMGFVSIAGPGPHSLTITNQNDTGVFEVSGSGSLGEISGLTLIDSNTTSAPGAITVQPGNGFSTELLLENDVFKTVGTPGGSPHDTVDVEPGTSYLSVQIDFSTFVGNSTLGQAIDSNAIEVAGATLAVNASTFSNYSTAILLDPSATGATLSESTFVGNNASGNGAVLNVCTTGLSVPVTILADTFANNLASGGIIAAGTATVPAVITDSIDFDNQSSGASTLNGSFKSGGYNDIQDDTGGVPYSGFVNGTQPTDLLGVDPLLAGLGDFGGSTPTDALEPGSPVLQAGDPALPDEDQRGITRSGTTPSIGAYEGSGVLFTVTSTGDNGGNDPAPDSTFNNLTGTLRQAIVDANHFKAGTFAIQFNITGADGTPQVMPTPDAQPRSRSNSRSGGDRRHDRARLRRPFADRPARRESAVGDNQRPDPLRHLANPGPSRDGSASASRSATSPGRPSRSSSSERSADRGRRQHDRPRPDLPGVRHLRAFRRRGFIPRRIGLERHHRRGYPRTIRNLISGNFNDGILIDSGVDL